MTHERCAFPGESCDARATKLLVGTKRDGTPVRIPLCAHHGERAAAHQASLDLWPTGGRDPLDERVVKARKELREHINTCTACQAVDDRLRRTMAAQGAQTNVLDQGMAVIQGACAEGQERYAALGVAMLGLEGMV